MKQPAIGYVRKSSPPRPRDPRGGDINHHHDDPRTDHHHDLGGSLDQYPHYHDAVGRIPGVPRGGIVLVLPEGHAARLKAREAAPGPPS